jgi:predicted nucleic acid-binding Zn ribbon protein
MQAIKSIIPEVLAKLRQPEMLCRQRILEEWPAVAGDRVAEHTKPSLSKDGKLYIWVDQSALAFELNQKYRHSILKRAQAVVGEEAVREIKFRVGQIR